MSHSEQAWTWRPTSPCGSRCTPAESVAAGTRVFGRIARLVVVVMTIAAGAPLLPLLPERARSIWLQRAARGVLAASGVRIDVVGPRPFGVDGVLVVANHVSWIEVLALSAVQPVRMVAKGEVRDWPGIGAVARTVGTVFVDRTRPHRLPGDVAQVGRALAAGHAVGVFPEGSTWCGAAAGRFRRALFQAAVDTDSPVRPVAITLHTPNGRRCPAASFVGDQTLLASVYRVLRLPGVLCVLTVLPTIRPDGDRADLARQAAAVIGATTGVPHIS